MRHAIVLRKLAGKLTACSAGAPLSAGTALARPSLLGTALAVFAVLLLPLVALAAAVLTLIGFGEAGAFALATAPAALDPVKIRDEILGAFNEFKQSNDERLAKIEKNQPVDTLLVEKVEKINDRISDLEAAKNRADLGAGGSGNDPERMKALNAYIRTGQVQAALQVDTDSEGGYTVADEFERQLIQGLEAQNVMRRLAKVIPSISGTKSIPVVSSHGTATWTAEEAAHTESDETFSVVTLGAHKVSRLIKVSKELLRDSAFDIAAYLAAEFARAIGAAEESAFVAGNGTGKPTGFTASSTLGVTAAGAAAVTANELIDLQHSLPKQYRAKAVFMAKDASVKAVRKLVGSDGQYLWQPSMQNGVPATLLGSPLESSEDMPAMTTGLKSWAYGDFSYYWIADRAGFSMQRLDELYAATGQVGFIGERRVDGKLTLAAAVRHLIQA